MDKKIHKEDLQQWFDASLVQKRLFISHTLQPESTNYNVTTLFTISGTYDETKIISSLRKCIQSNEMFMAKFRLSNGNLEYQIVQNEVDIEVIRNDEKINLRQFKEQMGMEFVKPFQMIGDRLYRLRVAFYDDKQAFIYLDCHHSIFDGNCVKILADDLKSAYESEQISAKHEYCDFVKVQEKNCLSESYRRKQSFWEEQYSEPSESCDFFTDNQRMTTNKEIPLTAKKISCSFLEKNEIISLCKFKKISTYSFFVAAVNLVIAQMTHQKDITIGTVASGRKDDLFEKTVGMFVNTFPIRTKINENDTVSKYIKNVYHSTRLSLKNSDVQYDEICKIINSSNENPLFQVMVRYQQSYRNLLELEGLTCKVEEILPEESIFDFELLIDEHENHFDMTAYYAKNVYKEETISIFMSQLENIVNQLLVNQENKLTDISFVDKKEQALILKTFNNTGRSYPKEESVTNELAKIFTLYKKRKSVVFEENSLTYDNLDRKSNILAHKLRELGIKANDTVGILAKKSVETIIGICAVIKAGGAYMPIDPDYPRERIDFLLQDSSCKVLLTYQLSDYIASINHIQLDMITTWEGNEAPLKSINTPLDTLYLMYTSGTTGNPKGVMVSHRNVMRLVKNTNFITFDENSKILQTGSLSFDASTLEIFGALLNGGTIYLAEKELVVSPLEIKEMIQRYQINTMFMTTSLFNQMISFDSSIFSMLDYILFGGEKASVESLRKMNQDSRNSMVKIINGYGPTEATTFSTTYECNNVDGRRVPIGKPIANSNVYIMKNGQLCGVGIPGELMIGGDGVSKGYLNQPELTKAKFIKNPFGEGTLYKSGDLAKWLPDGNIDYLGRLDEQVKIRGFRIELGEIESKLLEIEEINNVAVTISESDYQEKMINAYVTADHKLDMSNLKKQLRGRLPEYMIPAAMMQLTQIPITKNGKLDRKSLPIIQMTTSAEYVAPRNNIETTICEIIKEILAVNQVSMKDTFFELGGDSIKAIRIVSKMRDFGYDILVRDIMNQPLIEDIANAAKASKKQYNQEVVVGNVKKTPIITLFDDWHLPTPNHFNQAIMLRTHLENNILIKAIELCVEHHDILRAFYKESNLIIRDVDEGQLVDVTIHKLVAQKNLLSEIENRCNQLQSEINLEEGPLIKVGIFETAEEKKVFICIHHLVIDGVSWRIFIEDLEKAIHSIQNKEKNYLPPKTISFKEWSQLINSYKESQQLKKEIPYWDMVLKEIPEIQLDLKKKINSRTFDSLCISLSKEETKALSYGTSHAYYTKINDLLLSGLSLAVRKLTGQKKVSVVLEGHGREALDQYYAIDRTIGWFTTMYPVVLSTFDQVSKTIIETKELLKKIPNHGLGFGLLHDLSLLDVDIYFNYLGEMDGHSQKEGFELISSILAGQCTAKENGQPGSLNLNGMVEEGQLTFSIDYDSQKYAKEDMENFAAYFKKSLQLVISHCCEQKQSIKTISDYTAKDLSDLELVEINKDFSEIEDIYSLTSMQEGILFHYQMNENTTSYVIQTIYGISETLDENIVRQALSLTVLKHEVLKTAFRSSPVYKPRQIILKNREIEYETVDLHNLTAAKANEIFDQLIKQDLQRGFNLSKDSLIRMKQVRLPGGINKCLLSFHHIIMDGWCLSLVVGDFFNLYAYLASGDEVSTLERMIKKENTNVASFGSYVEYILNQNREPSFDYWKELLAEYNDISKIPALQPPIVCESEDEVLIQGIRLTEELTTAIKELALKNQATINTVLETAWGIILQKYNFTQDSVFGKIISGRHEKINGIQQIVGLFINAIPVRVQSENKTVNELIQSVQSQGNQSELYGNCPLVELQNLTKPGKELIQTLFVFENYYIDPEKLITTEDTLTFNQEFLREQTNYDLTISISLIKNELQCNLLFNPSKYQRNEIVMILQKLKSVLMEMTIKASEQVKRIAMCDEEERTLILNEFNKTKVAYPEKKSIVDLFEIQANKNPDKPAVILNDMGCAYLTYKELNNKANQVANALIEKGIYCEEPVAIIAEKGITLIVGILGILKAGGAYVPIDPAYPEERKNYLLKDLQVRLVLDLQETKIAGADVLNLTKIIKNDHYNVRNPIRKISANQLAYIIYTSGTSGKPKGTMIQQKSVIRLVKETNYLNFDEELVILQTGSMSFDAATFEIWGALLNGGQLILTSNETLLDKTQLAVCLLENKINTMWLTSSLFNQLLDMEPALFDSLTTLLVGGEKLSEAHVRRFKKRQNNVRLINGYGPTEGTTFTTTYEVPETFTSIAIGRPISNTNVYILADENLCGIGVAGELCIAGDGLAQGYWQQPDLTAEKFVVNPFGEGKLYHSGDLARWLPDGTIDYLGRIDEQVKIRGFRIELAEIEAVLKNMPAIIDATVIVHENKFGEKTLYGYYTSNEKVDIDDSKRYLQSELPSYMIPAGLMQLDQLPITVNGKLDKQALPEITINADASLIKPRNQQEELVADIFSEVLNLSCPSVNDSFFDIGGHSLRAVRVANRLTEITGKKVDLHDVFDNSTIEQLAKLIEAKEFSESILIPEAQTKDFYEMSASQKRIYFHNELEGNSILYNMPYAFEIPSTVNGQKLKRAFELLINQYEILRTAFVMNEDRLLQKICSTIHVDFEEFEYLEDLPADLYESLIEPFTLNEGNVIRIKLIRERMRTVLFVDMHHIVGDGMSFVSFLKKLGQVYKDQTIHFPIKQYKDYSEWMNKRDLSKQKKFWLDCYKEHPERADMPLDFPRKKIEIHAGKMIYEQIDSELYEKIKKVAKEQQVTEFILFLSALMILVSKYTQQETIVIGSPSSGRNHTDTENRLGMFANTLAMKGNPAGQKKYLEFLKELKEFSLSAFENQEYPFEELLKNLAITRDSSRNPLFDMMLVFQNNEEMEIELEGEKSKELKLNYATSKFDLTISVRSKKTTYELGVEFSTELYNESSVRKIIEHLKQILLEISDCPNQAINSIEMTTDAEKTLILEEFNATVCPVSKGNDLMEIFERSVQKHPAKIAIIYADEQMTYEELNKKANILANKLISFGIGHNDRVAIFMDRSIEMMVSIFAILKASATYVPIDKTYPIERISYILEDSAVKVVLSDDAIKLLDIKDFNGTKICLDEISWQGYDKNPQRNNNINTLAYIIYTSGTTGRPKGVMIEHKSVINLLEWMQQQYPLDTTDTLLQKTSYCFDVSISEIFWWYFFSGSLVLLVQNGEKEPEEITKMIDQYNISMVNFVPTMLSAYLSMLAENDQRITSLKYVISAGEALNGELVKYFYHKVKSKTKLINLYGPTESTVFASWYDCDDEIDRVPIGRPVGNGKLYIVNQNQLCGIGVPGELWIGGAQVAAGYLNAPELTKEKFIDNQFGEGKVYRSGDLARWLNDGTIEYYGRIDEQIKIRGYRIELNEVENALRSIHGICDTAVITKAEVSGEVVIYGYFTAERALNSNEIKKELAQQLPNYMIPTYLTQLDTIPITKNGKVNRQELLDVTVSVNETYVAPITDLQEKLCSIFSEVLHVERIGTNDNFFELGGDSIKAIHCVSKARSLKINLATKDILQGQTIENISDHLTLDIQPTMYCQESVTGTVVETPIMRIFNQWDLKEPNHFNQSVIMEIFESKEIIAETIKHLSLHHDLLRGIYKENRLQILPDSEKQVTKLDLVYVNNQSLEQTKQIVLTKCEEIQASFDLNGGSLIRFVYFETNFGKQLFICSHHLIMDGVSWQILLEDFNVVKQQLSENKAIELPAKTASFIEYSQKLEEYKIKKEVQKEQAYWDEVLSEASSVKLALKMKDSEKSLSMDKKYVYVPMNVPKLETTLLSQKAAKIYRLKLDEVLLSTLQRTMMMHTGQRKVAISLEGHGRELPYDNISVDRTIGWFTTMYPVVLDCFENIETGLLSTKEKLRSISHKGFHYGLLHEEGLMLDISFNYLGEMVNLSKSGKKIIFETGKNISENNRLPGSLNFNCWLADGQIVGEFAYDYELYFENEVNEFIQLFEKNLLELADFLRDKETIEMTASDYTAKDLTTNELMQIREKYPDVEKIYHLTDLQEGILFHKTLDEHSTEYMIQSVYELAETFDSKLLKQALDLLVLKYEVFKTAIINIAGPKQLILAGREIDYDKVTLEKESSIKEVAEMELSRSFNLENEVLFRVKEIVSNEKCYLILTFHHIIIDGWSISLIFSDLCSIYGSLKKGQSYDMLVQEIENTNKQKSSYEEYIDWLEKQDKEESLAYFLYLVNDYEEPAEIMPLVQPSHSTSTMERISVVNSKAHTKALESFAIENRVTLSVILESAWAILLQKYNGTKDVVFGKVVSGRNAKLKKIEEAVGLFVNTIPVRAISKEEQTVQEFLQVLQQQSLDGIEHEFIGLSDIQNETLLGNELIKTLFAFENFDINESNQQSEENELKAKLLSSREETGYPLTISSHVSSGRLVNEILYNPNLYTDNDIQLILDRLQVILEEIIKNPNQKITTIKAITKKEKEMILGEFNQTKTLYPNNHTITELFEEQVSLYPNKCAVETLDIDSRFNSVTYKELDELANDIAWYLIEQGLQEDTPVAIIADASIEMIAGMLGILKAGGVYVPIDISYPVERIKFIVEDCKSSSMVLVYNVNQEIVSLLNKNAVHIIDLKMMNPKQKCPPTVGSGASLAYIMYTSGTTGKPKGTMIENKSVVRLVKNTNYFDYTPETTTLQTGAIAFDASVFQIWGPLLNGGKVLLTVKDNYISPKQLKSILIEKKVNMLFLTTALFNQMISFDRLLFKTLDYLSFGGAEASVEAVKQLLQEKDNKNIRLCNLYGPTEGSSLTSYFMMEQGKEYTRIPIGKPLANTIVYVMQNEQLCGIGVPGELCITGDGVARGYWNREEMTKQSFVQNPFGTGKLYRSGDLVRWLPDGNLDFLGRIDEQVKIHGFRIELGEIESEIRRLPFIIDVAVIAKKDSLGEKAIYAYYTAQESVSPKVILDKLTNQLPKYMLPNYLKQIEMIPLNPQGKLDRIGLPDIAETIISREYEAPKDQIEVILCDIFGEILKNEKVSRNDHFFEIGGNSLRAMKLLNYIESTFHTVLKLKDIFEYPTIADLGKLIQHSRKEIYEKIPLAVEKDYYEMSPAQKRIFMLMNIDEETLTYNMPHYIKLTGLIDYKAIQLAFIEMINRHEILRTSFLMKDNVPVQHIEQRINIDFDVLSSLENNSQSLVNLVQPFALKKGNTVRMRVIPMQQSCILFIDMHHLVGDGMSMYTFLKEFFVLYNNEDTLVQPDRQYRDYSEWINHRKIDGQKEFWLKQFADEPPQLNLPLDFKRGSQQYFDGGVIYQGIGLALSIKIKEFTKEYGITDFMFFLSAVMILMGKYSQEEDIVIGTPVSGRIHQDTENILGVLVNTLAVRGYPKNDKSVLDFIREIKQIAIEAFENQEYPFEELIKEAVSVRDLSRNPLFDVMFAMQNNESMDYLVKEATFELLETKLTHSKFDLTFNIFEKDGEFVIALEYCTKLFKAESANRFVQHLSNVAENMIDNVQQPIKALNHTSNLEKQLILTQFNSAQVKYDSEKTLMQLFEEQVIKFRHKTAIRYKDQTVTYEKINEMANALAWKLRQFGVQPNESIGIISQRNIELIAAIYGVLKSGGAFVPIDSNYPEERIHYMLADCQAKIVLVSSDMQEFINREKGNFNFIILDKSIFDGHSENLPNINKPTDLAYIIYTSGTTGNPKGVMIEQNSVMNLLEWFQGKYLLSSNDVILQKTTYNFDVSVTEIFGWYLNGASLAVLPSGDEKEPEEILSTIDKYQVTLVNFVPTMLAAYLSALNVNDKRGHVLKHVLVAGEALNQELVKDFYAKVDSRALLTNIYGPTETTVYASSYTCSVEDEKVFIGKPISNTQLYVVNNYQLCGIGVPGELWIAGAGVARGYLNQKELTDIHFEENPFGDGLVYRTGDLVRWNSNGELEYFGRIDQQVKVRGFRIETGEIETTLRQFDRIEDAAVIVNTDHHDLKAIYGYFTANEELNLQQVRAFLSSKLPEYMVPTYLLQIEEIPITSNGKLAIKELPEIKVQSAQEYVSPENKVQADLCQVFEEVLNVQSIGIYDSFFELGGDSIKAIQCISKLRTLGYAFSVRDIIKNQTVKAISYNSKSSETKVYEQGAVKGLCKVVPILNTFNCWNMKKPEHFNQSFVMKVLPDEKRFVSRSLQEVVKHHDVLRGVLRSGKFEILDIDVNQLVEVKEISSDDYKEIEEQCNQIQQSMNLETGPLIKAAIINIQGNCYLMISIHHLVVDGVSWRIILEDIQTVIKQLVNNEAVVLPKKTASYIEWCQAITDYKDSQELSDEKTYWQEIEEQAQEAAFQEEKLSTNNHQHCYKKVETIIDKETTENLLYRSTQAFHTEIQEILLAALGLAVNELTGQTKLVVGLEGHGREELPSKIDIDRTVGWFTCMYPVVINCESEMKEAIINNKEMMRKVPHHGVGYGLLTEGVPLSAEIFFNYLGEINQEETDKSLRIGENSAPENQLPGIINLNIVVSEGKLILSNVYDSVKYEEDQMKDLLFTFEDLLKQLIEFCQEIEGSIQTKSDLEAKDLSSQDLDIINALFKN